MATARVHDLLVLDDIKEIFLEVPSEGATRRRRAGGAGLPKPVNRYDEVYPGIILGDRSLAENKTKLQVLGISYVLNAAQGRKSCQVDTYAAFYDDVNIRFLGVSVQDRPKVNLARHFTSAASFVHCALESGGRILVHCVRGTSRSAALVLAYLLIHRALTLPEAVTLVAKKRAILPNDGFLQQLCGLHNELFVTADDKAQG